MAIITRTYDSSETVYLIVRNDAAQPWDTVLEEFVTYADGDWVAYASSSSEQGTSGLYVVSMTNLPLSAGWYMLDWRVQAGETPAVTDPSISLEWAYWDGTVWRRVNDLAPGSITEDTFDGSTAFPLASADTGATAVMRAGADGDTGKTLSDQLDGILTATSGLVGTGARTVTLTVNDGTNLLEAARVRLTKGADTYVASTNASGVVTFYLDDGTWTVTITLAGYSFTATTLVVDGNESQTYSMSAVTIPASDPSFVTGYLYCYDEDGVAEQGAIVYVKAFSSTSTGSAYDGRARTGTSGADGLVTFTNLRPGLTYKIHRGTRVEWIEFTIPSTATETYALPDIVGEDE